MAGLAVGLVSLALQVSKGLARYIDSAKDANDRMTLILYDTERLAGCLEQLDLVVQSRKQSPSEGVVTSGIVACAEALEAIEKKLGAGGVMSGSKFRQRMRSLGQRLAFPFKQDNIQFLRDILGSMEQHLQTALFALQLEESEQIKQDTARLTQLCQTGFKDQHNLLLESTRHAHSTDQQMHVIQTEIAGLNNNLQPIATDLSVITTAVPDIMLQLSQLQEKINKLSIQEVSPAAIKQDVSDFTTIANDVKAFERRTSRKKVMKQQCTCRGQTNTTILLSWPIHLAKTEARIHNSDCPYSVYEEAVTNLQLRLTMCSTSLRRKAHIGLALSQGAGSVSMSPMLRCDRVVLKSSPAFRLMANFEKRLGPDPGFDAWEKPANELLRLFEMRKASPHDRLPNGMTLLHYFCYKMPKFQLDGEPESLIPNHYAMGKRVLEYLPTQALEKDDNGMTCVDYFLIGAHSSLVSHLLEHGISVSIWRFGLNSFNWQWIDLALQLDSSHEDIVDCSEPRKAVLLKNEKRLLGLIHKGNVPKDYRDCGYSLYEIATSVGWRRGCEILFENGFRIAVGDSKVMEYDSLLAFAINVNQEDIAQFWIEKRRLLDGEALEHAGSIEEVLMRSAPRKISSRPDLVSLCVHSLIQERQELQSLAVAHSIQVHKDRVLDAQAWSLIRDLEVRGVEVKPYLRPARRSVYHDSYGNWSIEVWDTLYEAGFRDVTVDDFANGDNSSISPLLYLATSFNGPSDPGSLDRVASWFMSKGSRLSETWPGSNLTVSHCLGFQLGNHVYDLATYAQWRVERFPAYFSNTATDSCSCACSSSGCCFITSFCKGITTPNDIYFGRSETYIDREWRSTRRSWRDRLQVMEAYIGEAASHKKNRWLVTEFIRLAVFNELGIRHTCCDPTRVLHRGDPNCNAKLGSRYDEDELRAVQEEDANLIDLLETLVDRFDKMFDRTSDDVETFFELTLVSKMDGELAALKAEDRRQFAQGRRDIGVIMSGESEEDEDDESSEEIEDDSDEESFEDEELLF